MPKPKTIRLWVPEDQETYGPPRSLEKGKVPPQPGETWLVEASSLREARSILALAKAPAPAMTDRLAYAHWALAADKAQPEGRWARDDSGVISLVVEE